MKYDWNHPQHQAEVKALYDKAYAAETPAKNDAVPSAIDSRGDECHACHRHARLDSFPFGLVKGLTEKREWAKFGTQMALAVGMSAVLAVFGVGVRLWGWPGKTMTGQLLRLQLLLCGPCQQPLTGRLVAVYGLNKVITHAIPCGLKRISWAMTSLSRPMNLISGNQHNHRRFFGRSRRPPSPGTGVSGTGGHSPDPLGFGCCSPASPTLHSSRSPRQSPRRLGSRPSSAPGPLPTPLTPDISTLLQRLWQPHHSARVPVGHANAFHLYLTHARAAREAVIFHQEAVW